MTTSAQAPATSYPVTVYVLPAARAAVARLRAERHVTNAEVVFNVLDRVQHELPQLITARRTTVRPGNSLFPSRVSRHQRRSTAGSDPTGGRRVLYQMRATAAEITVLDRLTEESGAESRSELVSVALEAALLPRR